MINRPAFATPTLGDFKDDTETLVHVFDDTDDDHARRHFVFYWVADNTGHKLSDRGVRGALGHENLAALVARTERGGGTIRFI